MKETTIREDLAILMNNVHQSMENGTLDRVMGKMVIEHLSKIHRKTADDQWTLMAAALGKIAQEAKWLRLTIYAANVDKIRSAKGKSLVADRVDDKTTKEG